MDLAALTRLKINFSHLISIRSFIIYKVTRTCVKSWMSLNFSQTRPLTKKLAGESPMPMLGKWRLHARLFERIIIKVACKQDMYIIA